MYENNSSILDEIKYQFKYGGVLTQLVLINLSVWIVLIVLGIIDKLFLASIWENAHIYDTVKSFIGVPSGLTSLATRFWTPLTYMFVHEGAWHIIFNMLWLWWFGKIFTVFLDVKKILPIYLLGGLAGAFTFILAYNLIPVFQGQNMPMIGASASVMAVVFATVALSPNYLVRMLFIGNVRIKYIALAMIIFDLLAISNMSNTGGHLAHLGGAAMGFFLMRQLQNGNDFLKPINNLFDKLSFKKTKKPKLTYKRPQNTQAEPINYQETIVAQFTRKTTRIDAENMTLQEKKEKVDEILDKIKEKGYDNLSKEEREFLFTYSNEV